MPLYEYRCETCGEKEEKLEGFSAPTEHACEHCGAASGMRRQISMSAFNLAGGGWVAQGYSHTPQSKAAGDSPAATPSASPASAATPASGGGCAGGCGCHPAKP